MAPRASEGRPTGPAGELAPRIVSALVLAPAAILIAYLGGVVFGLFIVAIAALMAVEWLELGRDAAPTSPAKRAAYAVAPALPIAIAVAGRAELALGAVVVAAAIAAVAARRARPGWVALGVAYIALPCIAVVWLRADPMFGRNTVLWLFAVVWATDIGAFAAGRLIGGPRLAPRISPNKTWAGLVGGMAAAAAAGALAAWALAMPGSGGLAAFGGFLGLLSQAGDLWESMVKRRSGKKDSGSLIPGHGGVLDRLDGMMAAAPALALAAIAFGDGGLRW